MGARLYLISLLFVLACFRAHASEPFLTVWKYSGEYKKGEGHVQNLQILDLRRDSSGKLARSESMDLRPTEHTRAGSYYGVEKGALSSFKIRDHSSNEIHSMIIKEMSKGYSTCHDILQLNQDFPLNQMIERNVISEGSKAALEQGLILTEPDRITFFEAVEVLDRDEVMAKYGEIPPTARRNDREGVKFKNDQGGSRELTDWEWQDLKINHPEEVSELVKTHRFVHTFDVKTSSAVAIAGQTPKGNFDLPLVKGLDGSALRNPIDRGKYPMIWEVGRLATIKAADIPVVMESLILQVKSETAILGRNLPEGGMLFAHAPDAAHARLYKSNYGMKFYSGYAGNDKEIVLALSIKEFTDRLKLKSDFGTGTRTVQNLRTEMIEANRHTVPYIWKPWGRKIEGLYIRDFSAGDNHVPLYARDEDASFREELVKMKAISFQTDAHSLHAQLANLVVYQQKFGLFRDAENILVKVSRQGDHTPEFTPEIQAMVEPSAKKVHHSTFYYWRISDAKKYMQKHAELFESLIKELRESLQYDPNDLREFWSKPLAGT